MVAHRGIRPFYDNSIALAYPTFLRARIPTQGDLRVKERKAEKERGKEKHRRDLGEEEMLAESLLEYM